MDAMSELKKKYPGASSSLSSDNFVPAWCLADLYQHATFDQFKTGFKTLQRDVVNGRNVTQNLIIQNAATFLAAHGVSLVISAYMYVCMYVCMYV